MGHIPAETGEVSITMGYAGPGLRWLRAIARVNSDGVAVARIPHALAGVALRYTVSATGTGPCSFAVYDTLGCVPVNVGAIATGTPVSGTLTTAVSTNRGAAPAPLYGRDLVYQFTGDGTDETGFVELLIAEPVDLAALDVTLLPGVPHTLLRTDYRWTSDSAGTATLYLDGRTYPRLAGVLLWGATLPDPSAAPTANYDIALLNDAGVDICDSLLANRAASSSQLAVLWHSAAVASRHHRPVAYGDLRLRVTNAGSGKGGTIGLYTAVPLQTV